MQALSLKGDGESDEGDSSMNKKARPTKKMMDFEAGCHECGEDAVLWHQPNAIGVAARHHDATGHTTWATVWNGIIYGDAKIHLCRPGGG